MTKLSQSEANSKNKIIIGKIGAARGLNGEVKIIPLTDFEDRFDNLKEVEIDGNILQIDYVKYVSNNIVIRFKEYLTREVAQKLTGKFLKVDRANAAPLAEGEFYTFDIIGLNVLNLDKKNIGIVTNVLKTGSNDVFVAKNEEGQEILIPALKRVVKKIDIAEKIMIIDTAMLEEI